MSEKVLISADALAVLMVTGETLLVSVAESLKLGEPMPLSDEMVADVTDAVLLASRALDALNDPPVSTKAGRA
jgi:hypothetical protein